MYRIIRYCTIRYINPRAMRNDRPKCHDPCIKQERYHSNKVHYRFFTSLISFGDKYTKWSHSVRCRNVLLKRKHRRLHCKRSKISPLTIVYICLAIPYTKNRNLDNHIRHNRDKKSKQKSSIVLVFYCPSILLRSVRVLFYTYSRFPF